MKKVALVLSILGCLFLTACGDDDSSSGGVQLMSEKIDSFGTPDSCGFGYDSAYTSNKYSQQMDAYNQKYNQDVSHDPYAQHAPVNSHVPAPPQETNYYSTLRNNYVDKYTLKYSNSEEDYYTNVTGGDDVICEKYQGGNYPTGGHAPAPTWN